MLCLSLVTASGRFGSTFLLGASLYPGSRNALFLLQSIGSPHDDLLSRTFCAKESPLGHRASEFFAAPYARDACAT